MVVTPPPDPSLPTGPQFGDLPEGLPHTNAGTFEGGETGTSADTTVNNVVQAINQREAGRFNVPSNGAPSPLFGAQPFSQQILRFEEFGTKGLDLTREAAPGEWQSLPLPANAASSPAGASLDLF